MAHGHAPVLPANTAVATDAADFKVAGVVWRAKPRREWAGRGTIDRAWGVLVQSFVGPLIVVELLPLSKSHLLRRAGRRRWPGGFS
jgi:hypothetical protein